MPRGKKLKGVALALLGRFVGRNNDIDGYWAMGKLYSSALSNDMTVMTLNLLTEELTPSTPSFSGMTRYFHQMLFKQMALNRLPRDCLSAANITISFTRQKSLNFPGDVFECSVILTDDTGRTREAKELGACRPHNPFKESRNSRI